MEIISLISKVGFSAIYSSILSL